MSDEKKSSPGAGLLLNYAIVTAGWLACAVLCLALYIKLEAFPKAYEVFFPAILLMLFGNIFIFLFIASRWSKDTKRLASSVLSLCAGEALFIAGIYCLSAFVIKM